MKTIGIVANGPVNKLPNLKDYEEVVDLWIGVDRGSIEIIKMNLPLSFSIGDFDSIKSEEREMIRNKAEVFLEHPIEKDQTDLEIAIHKAISLKPKTIYIFGATGGRLDHELINIQQLLLIEENNITGYIVDLNNILQLALPGSYKVTKDKHYPYISFIPFTKKVKKLTLKGFYYPLVNETISWGSTLCLSNELVSKNGTFLFDDGILLVIKSRD